MGDMVETAPLQRGLRRSIELKYGGWMDDMKATLQCHVHISRSEYRGTAASNTTPGFILPVIIWALDGYMVINRV